MVMSVEQRALGFCISATEPMRGLVVPMLSG